MYFSPSQEEADTTVPATGTMPLIMQSSSLAVPHAAFEHTTVKDQNIH